MPSEWLECTLGDCITLRSGGTPSKSNPEYWGGEIPWVSAKDMKSFWVNDSEDKLTVLGAKAATRLVEPGSTLLLVRGMTLHKDIPVCRVRQTSAFNQDVKAVVAKGKLQPSYMPHLLVALKPRLLASVDSAGHGTERVNDFETDCGLSSGAAPTAAESRRDHGNRLRVSHSPLENPAGFPHLTAAGVNHHAIFPFSKDSGRLIQAGPGSAGGFGRPFGKRSGWSW